MDNTSSQYQSTMCTKQCYHCLKPIIKYKGMFYKNVKEDIPVSITIKFTVIKATV